MAQKKISKVQDIHCGYFLTVKQKSVLTKIVRQEFKKPKHLRTTPYLLIKQILKNPKYK